MNSDKVTIVYVAQGYLLEAREPGVRGIWNEGGDDDLFREHMKSLEEEVADHPLSQQVRSETVGANRTGNDDEGEGAPGSALTGDQNRCHVR